VSNSDPSCEVVVTGIGCVSSLGPDRETFWSRLIAGECGLRRLTESDFRGLPAGERPGFPLIGGIAAPVGGARDPEPLLGLVSRAAAEAVDQAGLSPNDYDPIRAGCVIGTSKGGLFAFRRAFKSHRSAGTAKGWEDVPPHAASSAVARRFALRGPCLAPVAACATGLVSVLRGFDLIRDGMCDAVVAGSGDASIHPAVLGSFRRMGVLATRIGDPVRACRPFNADRDGFAVGEGAAVFVLERRTHAAARGASPIATVLGGALLSDPSGLTAVDPRGEALARAVQDVLRRTGLSPADVGHVNLHGTATRANDAAEAAGLRRAFGASVDDVPCTALKSALGHQLGAAGAVELAATALAIRDGVLPPTGTFTDPDPGCRLRLSRSTTDVRGFGLKVSLGFGGHIAVTCLGPP